MLKSFVYDINTKALFFEDLLSKNDLINPIV
jgi:hypothetical protein